MLIDSHAHLDLPELSRDKESVVRYAREQGIDAIINVGLDVASSRVVSETASQYPGVFATVGFHPHSASEMTADDLKLLGELAGNKRVVAVGETGLDFYRNYSARQQQLDAFRMQLRLSVELELPVIIHCRQAHREVMDILEAWAKSLKAGDDRRGVIHCFSGDTALAHRYTELGFYISLAGSLTYPNATELVGVARELPLSRLLVETDSPFLAPQGHRGQRNEPARVRLVAEKIARARGITLEEVAQVTKQNTVALFRLPSFEEVAGDTQ